MVNSSILLCVLSVLLSGLLTGCFFAFSDFGMKGLASAEPNVGMRAMQSINRQVYRSAFIALLIGFAAYVIGFSAYAWYAFPVNATWAIVAGSLFYLIGVIVVTIKCNVPMNHTLESLDSERADALVYWTHYVRVWTRWNHLRTIALGISTLCFLLALIRLSAPP